MQNMTIISHYTKADAHTQSDGTRYVKHVFTDHLGKIFSLSSRVDGAWSDAEYELIRLAEIPKIEQSQADSEIKSYLYKLRSAINPFIDDQQNPANPDYQTRNEAIRRCLKFIGNLSADEVIEFKDAIQFLAGLPQAFVEARGFNYTRYQNWLTKAANIKSAIETHETLEVNQ